ncbi:hypothetical protein FJ930_27190 [Mesorhizobium sp. B2-4-15]|uniref:hypothetical protein n=1 Tax=Mesorhizobium sp. B2-4-15 TaxID=2589934 RepID=UPI00114DAEF4|nr:hypothetical protein [Mesorhizobium sp. B2-4-15]TPK62128.1 hypothetical protein FJ930_27190 [Mesorhizobium sp. B2-4-15]
MPLQNRVDPFGAIHAVPERGLFTGNRGIIHDPETKTLLKKRWALQAWIICVCQFRNVRREPMGRNRPGGKPGWTELFFLDEVTALAAGHRPCFFCQRERARDFVGHFGKAFGIAEPRAPQVDRRLHKERLASGGQAVKLDRTSIMALPDGTMIAAGNRPYALRDGAALPWSFGGYGPAIGLDAPDLADPFMITPMTAVAVLGAGYRPAWAS